MKIKKINLQYIGFIYCVFYSLTRACLGAEFGRLPYLVFLGVMSLEILVYFLNYSKQKQKIMRNSFYVLYFVYLAFIFFNLAIAKQAYSYAIYEYVFYLLMFFAVCNFIGKFKFESLLYFYEFMGVVLSVEALWEFFTGNLPYRASTELQAIRRACGLLGTPLTLGTVLACISLIALFWSIKTKIIRHYVSFALCFLGLLATQSRGPLVGFIVAFFVLICLLEYQKTGNLFNTAIKNLIGVALIFGVLYLIVLFLNGKNDFVTTIYSRIETITMWQGEDYSNALRKSRWELGLKLFYENPIIGYGVSSTGNHAITGINVESGVIKKLVETGIIGFLIYYVMFGLYIIRGMKTCIRCKAEFHPVSMAIIIAVFVENMVLQSIESVAVFMLFIINFTYLFMERYKRRESWSE